MADGPDKFNPVDQPVDQTAANQVAGSSIPQPSRRVAVQEIDGEVVILDLKGRTLRGLSATGGQVWRLMKLGRTVEQIAKLLAASAEQPDERVLDDTLAFFTKLLALRLVELTASDRSCEP